MMHQLSFSRVMVDLCVFLPVYFLPTMLASRTRCAKSIFALNMLLGWTVVGWIVASLWALTAEKQMVSASSPTGEHLPVKTEIRRCHICTQHSKVDAMFCLHCGTALIPAELRTIERSTQQKCRSPIVFDAGYERKKTA